MRAYKAGTIIPHRPDASRKRAVRRAITAAMLLAVALVTLAASAYSAGSKHTIEQAIDAQERHTDALLKRVGVVGTAVGLDDQGEPVVLVLARSEGATAPSEIEGIPVVVRVTGDIVAFKPTQAASKQRVDHTASFARPVPLGVSTGNEDECSAGTIGARVIDSASVYALSNNHVYALENTALPRSRVLQPGLYDTGCVLDSGNVIGTLDRYVPIVFSTTASNVVDAAIAASTTGALSNATTTDCYGTPTTATFTASVGLDVQKCGRTTSLTKGRVTAINATVNVGYSSGTARFIDQIIVQGNKPFSKAGDSGSLVVNMSRNPVGLLFAGSSTITVANPIDSVLSLLGVTIDGS